MEEENGTVTRLNVDVPLSVKEFYEREAKKDDRSLSTFIRRLLIREKQRIEQQQTDGKDR